MFLTRGLIFFDQEFNLFWPGV